MHRNASVISCITEHYMALINSCLLKYRHETQPVRFTTAAIPLSHSPLAMNASSLFEEIVKIAKSLVPYVSNIVKSVGLTGILVASLGTYLVVVRVLRYKRYRLVHKKYQEKYEERTLTPEEAQEVMRVSTGYDMPMLLNYSLAFALFKTYAVVSLIASCYGCDANNWLYPLP